MRRQKTQRRAEIVQNQLWPVVSCFSVAGDLFRVHPVTDTEMEGRALGQMDDGETGDALGILVHNHKGGEIAVRCELADFTDRELVRVSMRIASDVDAVGEKVDQLFGFVVEV